MICKTSNCAKLETNCFDILYVLWSNVDFWWKYAFEAFEFLVHQEQTDSCLSLRHHFAKIEIFSFTIQGVPVLIRYSWTSSYWISDCIARNISGPHVSRHLSCGSFECWLV